MVNFSNLKKGRPGEALFSFEKTVNFEIERFFLATTPNIWGKRAKMSNIWGKREKYVSFAWLELEIYGGNENFSFKS